MDNPWDKVILIIAVTALFFLCFFFYKQSGFKISGGDWECHRYDGYKCIEWKNVKTGTYTLIDPN